MVIGQEVARQLGARFIFVEKEDNKLVLRRGFKIAPGEKCLVVEDVVTKGGRHGTGKDALAWIREGVERGAGEILLNSMDADGTKAGFDLELIRAVRARVDVPLIASGGAGAVEHFAPAVAAGADAVLAATVFHFGEFTIADVKKSLREAGHPVR